MRRFFIDPLSITADTAYLSETESRHIATVLRLRKGDDIELFDGTGKIYHGEIRQIQPHRVNVHLLSVRKDVEVMNTGLFLYLAMLKGKKMDFLVQKSTELGVHTLQPVLTRFSENRGNHSRQYERWQRIMLEACKQCNRPVPMDIQPVKELKHLSFNPEAVQLLLWEEEQQHPLLPSHLPPDKTVCLLLGPEGGFHAEEVSLARERGFQPITLGKRTLRAETAALASISIIQYLMGGLGK